jgi:NTE family protein
MGSDVVTEPRLAIVLSGAAARGAFQAGALATVLRGLEQQGERPAILIGTSAGAINAALWGSTAHLGAKQAGTELLGLWRGMSDDDVYESIVREAPGTMTRFIAGAVLQTGRGLTSLLDTGPFGRTADAQLDAGQLHANIADGVLDAVGVVATRMPPGEDRRISGMSSGRTVLFLDERTESGYVGDPLRAQDVVRTPIQAEHVVASAAIPAVFPAQFVEIPSDAAGWYVDGGVRENTPLGHAVRLGADRIIVISATSTEHGQFPPIEPGPPPDMTFAGAQALHAVLSDRMIEDILAIRRINYLVEQFHQVAPSSGLHALPRNGAAGSEYRRIEFKRISPPPGQMGEVAGNIAEDRARLRSAPTESDNFLLTRALRGAGTARGYRELISYFLFDPQYFTESIEIGERVAQAALAAPWET